MRALILIVVTLAAYAEPSHARTDYNCVNSCIDGNHYTFGFCQSRCNYGEDKDYERKDRDHDYSRYQNYDSDREYSPYDRSDKRRYSADE